MEKIKIIIVDDHKMLRESFTVLLNNDKRFTVVAQCASGEEAISVTRARRPDVVIMDINMPGLNGFETSKQISRLCPEAKILGVSMNKEVQFVRKMMKCGVMGYVTKNSTGTELIKAVWEISCNRKYICTEIKNSLAHEMLETEESKRQIMPTERESKILSLISNGLTSKEISVELNLSVKTIEAHRYNVRKKLNLKNMVALTSYVHKNPSLYSEN